MEAGSVCTSKLCLLSHTACSLPVKNLLCFSPTETSVITSRVHWIIQDNLPIFKSLIYSCQGRLCHVRWHLHVLEIKTQYLWGGKSFVSHRHLLICPNLKFPPLPQHLFLFLCFFPQHFSSDHTLYIYSFISHSIWFLQLKHKHYEGRLNICSIDWFLSSP